MMRPMASDTRLVEAAQQGDLAAAEAALSDGADVNGRDQFGQTVLCWAIFNRHPEVAKLLLARGADPSLKGSMVRPVTAAASQGLIEIVRELLARDAQIDDNAATLARINDHADIVALLDAEVARRTAVAEAETEEAVPAIFAAAEAGDVTAIEEALAREENCEAVDADG